MISSATELTSSELIDTALVHNLPPSNYFAYWDLFGRWQLNSLISIGMTPQHYLLDIGCGALRLGLRGIDYLDDDHYCGIDAFESYIRLGHDLVRKTNQKKSYSIKCDSTFNFKSFNKSFDFAVAQSVFTHLSIKQIDACLRKLAGVISKNGKLLFTYILEIPDTVGFMYEGTHFMQRPRIDNTTILENLGNSVGASFITLNLEHPTGQHVGLYSF